MPKEFSAGVVIYRMERGEPKYLILKHERGHWDFVKGNVEKNEKLRETMVRETLEETGIRDLKFNDDFENKISYFYRRQGKTVYKEVVFHLAETKTQQIRISPEHVDCDWVNYEDALKKLSYENSRKTLIKAHKKIKEKQKTKKE
ncbi:MAG: NUDIX domain-containing protein [Candidatus Freyarchaeota archaeon]|nr:NUDIX domain-containing protein [Candidatus Jordarchaeia archaeon]MBS7269531.1 NUDIX domain-containing protein [Candidatus Jordarchaeia archaeon]MBS7280256.1 NUDIX domain-containing protein [Candidatus Jordarchaeia archaeon]